MATYYTDWAVGNDGNLGTSEGAGNAWKTINKALDTVVAGDTVYVKATGPYLETAYIDTAGTASLTITLEGYTSTPGDGGQATIDAENTRTNCVDDTLGDVDVYYVFKNFIFKRATGSNVALSVDELIFKNCRFTDAVSHGCEHPGEITFEDCLFDNNGGDGDDCNIGYCAFIGCRFVNNTENGIEFSNNARAFSCVFVGNSSDAIASLLLNGSQILIVGCTIDGDGKTTNTGIDCGTSYWKRIVIVNTIVYDCVIGIRISSQGTYFVSRNNLLFGNTTDYTNFQTFTGEVLAAPQFEDEAGGDYALADASPAREAGYDGYSLNGSTQLRDIGAIESTAGTGGGGLLMPNKRAGKQ